MWILTYLIFNDTKIAVSILIAYLILGPSLSYVTYSNLELCTLKITLCTGKSLSETFIFAPTNPQYDKRLFMKIASSEHVENMLCTQIGFYFDIQNNLCTQHVLNMFWACNFHEQSFVILWDSWCKNKCFWKRFTCTSM